MFRTALKQSHFPAQPGRPLLDLPIGASLRLAAEEAPDRPALIAYGEDGSLRAHFTYRQLYETAALLAARLASDYEPGDRIAVWAPNIPQWVLLEYAAALSGLVLVTLNPSYQRAETSYVIGQSGAKALFHVQQCRGNPIAAIAREVRSEQPGLRDLIDMQDDVAFFGEPDSAASSLPTVAAADIAQLQYTSGTTGTPKGAMLTHRGLLNNALLVAERLALDERSRYLNMMPMFHTSGCGLGTLMPLAVRGCAVLVEQYAPALVNDLIEREAITCLLGVPTMLLGLLEDLKLEPREQSSLKTLIAGGSMVSPGLVNQCMRQWGCPVQVGYGQTETSPVLTQTWKEDALADLTETIGQPLPHTELAILDPDSGAPLPTGAIGEICARGYMLMSGYHDNPEATAATIDGSGWLHTGDLGTMDERGYVRITGRLKEMIIRGGENLYPAEIENAMLDHPAIAEVAVIGLPDERWGEVVGCFLRWEPGATPLSAQELSDHALARLSPQKRPRYWIALENWPLTASGKIRKFKLREMFDEGACEPL